MDALYSAATGLVDRAKDWEACELVRRRPRLAEGWPELGEVLRRWAEIVRGCGLGLEGSVIDSRCGRRECACWVCMRPGDVAEVVTWACGPT